MNTRLQQFLSAENISQAQLADSLHVARAGISHILAGRNKPSYDFLTSLMLRFPKLNIEWLMFGKGKMYKENQAIPETNMNDNSQDEPKLLFNDYDLLDDGNNLNQENEIPLPAAQRPINIEATHKLDTSGNISQNTNKQRNIIKIIVLFDDGTFQEM